jgi:hypothetical protein
MSNARAHHLRDMLAAVAEWSHASGPERDYWRGVALYRIAAFRSRFLKPERAAFEAAVARSYRRAA